MGIEESKIQFYDHINVLIKPTDGCNLRCKYCFHQDTGYNSRKMSLETLQHFWDITMPHYKSISVIWHGGEPTYVGANYFRKCTDLTITSANKYGVKLSQTIQTNGTLLTEDFVKILKEASISIGISYDGPINQITRNSTTKLCETNKLLSANGINFGTIAVISGLNVLELIPLYEHMKQLKKDFQMNPYINTSKNAPSDLAMSFECYLEQMRSLYLYWLQDETCNITVDPFMRMIRDSYVGRSSLCTRSSCLRNWFCLNVDGTLSPCDRDFPEEFCYGNVKDYSDIREIYNSSGYKNLITKAIIRRNKCKKECDVYSLCEGGCNNNALFETGIENNGGFSCIVTKGLLHLVRDSVEEYEMFGETPIVRNPVLLEWLAQQKERRHSGEKQKGN